MVKFGHNMFAQVMLKYGGCVLGMMVPAKPGLQHVEFALQVHPLGTLMPVVFAGQGAGKHIPV